jgi:putative hydrolase
VQSNFNSTDIELKYIHHLNLKEDYHVHCNYNDHSEPDLTIRNVVKRAEDLGLRTLAFTEHVRSTSSWIQDYLSEIDLFIKHQKIKIIAGFEAKILKDGSIDCPKQYSNKYLVIASFHNSFNNKKIWMNALQKAIENPDVDIIGHLAPEPAFKVERNEIDLLASIIADKKKIVEINAKYHRPPADWIHVFKSRGVKFQLGSDAHALRDVGQFDRISDLISLVDK